MKTATLQIQRNSHQALEKMGNRFSKVWESGKEQDTHIQFESPQALFSVLTLKRWELIEKLQTIGPCSLRGLARELNRDVKRVHEDVHTLMEWGLVGRTAEGKLIVPFERIHADFDIQAMVG